MGQGVSVSVQVVVIAVAAVATTVAVAAATTVSAAITSVVATVHAVDSEIRTRFGVEDREQLINVHVVTLGAFAVIVVARSIRATLRGSGMREGIPVLVQETGILFPGYLATFEAAAFLFGPRDFVRMRQGVTVVVQTIDARPLDFIMLLVAATATTLTLGPSNLLRVWKGISVVVQEIGASRLDSVSVDTTALDFVRVGEGIPVFVQAFRPATGGCDGCRGGNTSIRCGCKQCCGVWQRVSPLL
mmetsp:Transcript_25715/g.56565  ORF Transcript_25715/g.56565 Transcript_25715/m.56565 type:complete len:245 (+) Transcript_25715:1833-2567(+)